MTDISVIIPVYNDQDGIRQTLESLTNQTMDRNRYEVLVVDNKSTDNTASVIKSFPVVYLQENDVQSSYAARNTGWQNASGDVFAFIDADMIAPPGWLENILEEFNSVSAQYLSCSVIVKNEQKNLWSKFDQFRSFPIEWYIENNNFAPTCSLVVSRELCEELNGFVPHLVSGGDAEFGQRAHRRGFEQHYTDGTYIYHPARGSFSEMLSKSVRIGNGIAQIREYQQSKLIQLSDILPVHPIRYYHRLNDEYLSAYFVLFYLIECVLKMAKLYGILEKTVTNSILNFHSIWTVLD